MKFNRTIHKYWIAIGAVIIFLAPLVQYVHTGAAVSSNSRKQCARRGDLTFNDVGLWTRLPEVLKRLGQPLRIETKDSINKNRVNANYYYKDIELLIFNSIVWQIKVLTPDISSKSGIRLEIDFSEVEKKLDVKLRKPSFGRNDRDIYKIPICPPDPPEVEEYVVLGFDQKNRLVEFTALGVFP